MYNKADHLKQIIFMNPLIVSIKDYNYLKENESL